MSLRTQIGIVGAGPAGLMLSHLLHRQGIDSIVVEARSRQYVEERVRAGVLEQGTADLMAETGIGDRLKREGLIHHGVMFRFAGRTHRFDFDELANGRCIIVYPQNKVVADLFDARAAAGGRVIHGSGRRERARFREREWSGEVEDSIPRGRRIAGNRMRLHRRMRRLSRHLPAVDSRRAR